MIKIVVLMPIKDSSVEEVIKNLSEKQKATGIANSHHIEYSLEIAENFNRVEWYCPDKFIDAKYIPIVEEVVSGIREYLDSFLVAVNKEEKTLNYDSPVCTDPVRHLAELMAIELMSGRSLSEQNKILISVKKLLLIDREQKLLKSEEEALLLRQSIIELNTLLSD
jgi:hypothetical protein